MSSFLLQGGAAVESHGQTRPRRRRGFHHRMALTIVMAYPTDPVGNGLVASLAHPRGNITELAGSSDDRSPKQLVLPATVMPNPSRFSGIPTPRPAPLSSTTRETPPGRLVFLLGAIEAPNIREFEDAFGAFAHHTFRWSWCRWTRCYAGKAGRS